ncbi:MAG: TetR/AcrR family transcriptional regulator [Gordonia sp. (in: high G+C Gram-positive bacteria)]
MTDDQDSTRDRIVAAGVALLAEDGLDGVGLRSITRRAGVSHGAPRRYFPTHRALLAAIARTGVDDLAAELMPQLTDTGLAPRDRLVAAGGSYLDFARRRRAMFELMFRHDILDGAGGFLRTVSIPLATAVHDVVTGEIADDDWVRTLGLWGALHGLAVLVANRVLEPLTELRDVDIDMVVRRAVDTALG